MKARSRILSNTSKLTRNLILMGILLTILCSIAYAETNVLPVSINEQTSTTLSIDKAKEIAAFYLVELSGTIPEFVGMGKCSC